MKIICNNPYHVSCDYLNLFNLFQDWRLLKNIWICKIQRSTDNIRFPKVDLKIDSKGECISISTGNKVSSYAI